MRAHADTHPETVPLLVFIGPPGVGKSSAARELVRLLEETGTGFAYVDRDEFGTNGLLHEDPLLSLNELLHARVAAGAERLVVAWRVESGLELARFRAALGWTDITVCRLSAPLATLIDRIACGGQSEFQSLHLETMAREIAPRLERQASEDILLATDDAAPAAVAMRALRQWAMRGAPLAADAAA
jgi:DNA polymerase III delta prime subunit